MVRIIKWFSLALVLVVTTSCIDLLNEIKVNADQSGRVFLGVEASALGMLANLDPELVDDNIRKSVKEFPIKAMAQLQNVQGITNVEALSKIGKGRIGIQFDFADTKALNAAYYALAGQEQKFYYPDIIKIDKHKVKVRNMTPFINRYLEKNQKQFMNNEMIKYFSYSTTFDMPTAIKSGSIKRGQVGTSENKMENKIPMNLIIKQKQKSGTKFRY